MLMELNVDIRNPAIHATLYVASYYSLYTAVNYLLQIYSQSMMRSKGIFLLTVFLAALPACIYRKLQQLTQHNYTHVVLQLIASVDVPIYSPVQLAVHDNVFIQCHSIITRWLCIMSYACNSKTLCSHTGSSYMTIIIIAVARHTIMTIV